MSNDFSVALVGAGGYGAIYLAGLLREGAARGVRLVAAVDLDTAGAHVRTLAEAGVPQYASMDEMYRRHRPDLVILSSPIQFHAAQAAAALAHGSHVLCEKPLAATVEQGLEMLRARDASGKTVSVGYQWSFCPVIAAVKRDVAAGRLGRPRRLRTLALWPRSLRYYTRNRWAGREVADDGAPIFDSPANNACAHYLHNMLFVLGNSPCRSAIPARVTAELYRANPIQSYDTAAIHCLTADGVPLQFVASHAAARHYGPALSFEFEDATVQFLDEPGGALVARFRDGQTHSYGSPVGANEVEKLWAVAASIRAGEEPSCGIEASLPHAQVVAAARLSSGGTRPFPAPLVRTAGTADDPALAVAGLAEDLSRCHDEGRLPAELGFDWAVAGTPVKVPSVPAAAHVVAGEHAPHAPAAAHGRRASVGTEPARFVPSNRGLPVTG